MKHMPWRVPTLHLVCSGLVCRIVRTEPVKIVDPYDFKQSQEYMCLHDIEFQQAREAASLTELERGLHQDASDVTKPWQKRTSMFHE